MKFKLSLSLLLIIFVTNLIAQTHTHTDNDHHHKHAKNEIGIVNAPVYLVKEKAMAYSIHLHYLRMIEDSKFGLGVGYERLFNEHKHNTFGIVGSYRPIDRLSFSFSPGITFEDEEPSELNLALHFEAVYEFEFHHFHIGPTLGFAYDPEDYHVSLGLHIGYGF